MLDPKNGAYLFVKPQDCIIVCLAVAQIIVVDRQPSILVFLGLEGQMALKKKWRKQKQEPFVKTLRTDRHGACVSCTTVIRKTEFLVHKGVKLHQRSIKRGLWLLGQPQDKEGEVGQTLARWPVAPARAAQQHSR